MAVADLADYGLELPVDSDAYNSVGGFVFAELGRLPRRGDTVNADGYSIRVESVRENRVEAVRIRERRVARSREAPEEELQAWPSGARRATWRAPSPPLNTSGPRGGAGRTCALGGGGCAIATIERRRDKYLQAASSGA